MSPKRGDRVARPTPPGRYTLRFATNEAVKGWENLCQVTGGGRIWYLVDHDRRICWIKLASTGHPKATD